MEKKKLTATEITTILDRYIAGESVEDIARSLSISKSTVWSHLRVAKLISKPKKGNPSFTDEQILELVKEIELGKSIRQIAKERQLPYATVQKNLQKLNLDLKEKNRGGRTEKLSKEEIIQICLSYKEGVSSIELGKKYNVSKDTILKYIKEQNIEINRNSKQRITKNTLPINKLENIYLRYKEGISIETLAIEYNVKAFSLRNQLKKTGFILSNVKIDNREKREIRKKYKNGQSSVDLAKEYNVSHTLINEILSNRPNIEKHRHSSKTLKANESKLSSEIIQEIFNKHSNGFDIDLIAESLQLTPELVSKVINRRIKTNLAEEQIQKLCTEYEKGQKVLFLAKSFDLSEEKVRIILKSRGVKAINANKLTLGEINEITNFYQKGISPVKIAKILNINESTIRYHIKKTTKENS